MIHPIVDSFLILLGLALMVMVWIYAVIISERHGKIRYIVLLQVATIIMLVATQQIESVRNTALEWPLAAWVGTLYLHCIYFGLFTIRRLAYLCPDIMEYLYRLSDSIHDKKDSND